MVGLTACIALTRYFLGTLFGDVWILSEPRLAIAITEFLIFGLGAVFFGWKFLDQIVMSLKRLARA